MNFSINTVVYFYIFICIALLVFNVLYIFRTEGRNRTEQKMVRQWSGILERILTQPDPGNPGEKHLRYQRKRLVHVGDLTAFNTAIEPWLGKAETQAYLDACSQNFQELAYEYRRRAPMERAFFAYVIARCHPSRESGGQRLIPVLLEYLEASTIYCRENVLQALYAIGDASAVEQALRFMNDKGWYHHSHMLSDGLSSFQGDRAGLAASLWEHCRGWDENYQISVVQFAANVTDQMKEPFARALTDPDTPEEVRFALVRYFSRYPTPEVRDILFSMVREGMQSGGPAVVACSALAKYPGSDTVALLEEAICSRNWYIRQNAASSLVALSGEEEAYAAAERSGDRYAREMLNYVTGRALKKEGTV